jgi:hypothetical protein
MGNAPLLLLYRVPASLSAAWQGVFGSLVRPLYTARCFLNDPHLILQTEPRLRSFQVQLEREKAIKRQVVERLYGVAPKSFDAGWAIRSVVDPLSVMLGGFLDVKVTASQTLAQFLLSLRQHRVEIPERRLLEGLHEAVAAERGIDLANVLPAPPRVRCVESDRSVSLDGNHLVSGVALDVFRFFRAIAEAYPDHIKFKTIQAKVGGLRGKNPTRDLRDRLPDRIHRLVKSDSGGYYLELPPPK